jgi:hypothetical protein
MSPPIHHNSLSSLTVISATKEDVVAACQPERLILRPSPRATPQRKPGIGFGFVGVIRTEVLVAKGAGGVLLGRIVIRASLFLGNGSGG